jgi:hypothetical protein
MYQEKRHGAELDVGVAFDKLKNGKYKPPRQSGVIDAPAYQEQNIQDVNAELSHNADIKTRLK